MKLLASIFHILFLLGLSCKNPVATKITVINKSDFIIDSLKISTYGLNLNLKNIKREDTISYDAVIDFKDYEGNFLTMLSVKDSITKVGQFGYFANENDIKPRYTITVNKNLTISESPF